MDAQGPPIIRPLRGDEAQDLLARNWNYDRAVAALRRLLPATLTPDDPAPHRNVVFGVHAAEISGRCSVANGAAVPANPLVLMR